MTQAGPGRTSEEDRRRSSGLSVPCLPCSEPQLRSPRVRPATCSTTVSSVRPEYLVSLQIIRIMIIIKSFLLSAQANFKQIALKKCCSACPLYGRKKPHWLYWTLTYSSGLALGLPGYILTERSHLAKLWGVVVIKRVDRHPRVELLDVIGSLWTTGVNKLSLFEQNYEFYKLFQFPF